MSLSVTAVLAALPWTVSACRSQPARQSRSWARQAAESRPCSISSPVSTGRAVTVAGQRIDKLTEAGKARFRRRQIGMIFQFFNLLDDLTVLDNVLLPAELAGVRRASARARADELLAALRISQHAHAYPARLSGGERQRVAIARALINRPALLLADEPTGPLDTAAGDQIGDVLLDLNRAGQTLLLVTHNPELAARYASRTVQLVDGCVASETTNGAWR